MFLDKEKQAAAARKYRENNRAKCAAATKKSKAAKPEQYAAANKAYRDSHKNERADYNRAYNQDNKEKVNERRKKWRRATPEKQAAYCKKYRLLYPEKCAARDHATYERNKEKKLSRNKSLSLQNKEFMDAVKLYYGCTNPECKWDGNWSAKQLDMHHIYPNTKIKDVCQMVRGSVAKLCAEVNKCCVLCANCHRLETTGQLDASNFQKCHVTSDRRLHGYV